MHTIVNLYSPKEGEISRFLNSYYNKEVNIENDLKWENTYENPIEIADIIGSLIDNNDKYNINMWISLDTDTFVNVTEYNVDNIIRYLYERFPY
jgi:hypothetical protein